MPIHQTLVVAYAKAIYIDGTKRFSLILDDYVSPVKQYAASTYTLSQIDNALTQGYITQQEYDDTIALIP